MKVECPECHASFEVESQQRRAALRRWELHRALRSVPDAEELVVESARAIQRKRKENNFRIKSVKQVKGERSGKPRGIKKGHIYKKTLKQAARAVAEAALEKLSAAKPDDPPSVNRPDLITAPDESRAVPPPPPKTTSLLGSLFAKLPSRPKYDPTQVIR